MNGPVLAKYTVAQCVVVGHQHYGLIVESDSGSRGFVDRADMADAPVSSHEWPAVGDEIRAVVLGYTREGRIRLTARKMDVLLMESLDDPVKAIQEWQTVKESGVSDIAARERFYQSPNAVALLRWAHSHPDYSPERQLAQVLLSKAPVALKAKLGLDT